MSDQWLTVAQTAEVLQVSVATVRRMITRGELSARRIGPRLIRVEAASVAAVGRNLWGSADV